MGTTEVQPETGAGYIQRAGHTASIIREITSDTAYGRRGGSLYPVVLIVIAAILVLLDVSLVSLVPLVLLAIWIGGRQR